VGESERLDRLIAAEQDERRRLALFLHDGPVQELSGIALMLDAAAHLISTGRANEAEDVLATALKRHRETIRALRDLSFALEPVVLRDQGFGPALQALADQLGAAYGVTVDLDLDSAGDVGMTAQIALYTIIRELLDQSIRRVDLHAITVAVTRGPEGDVLTVVADDAEPERRLRSFEVIEERVQQIHGHVELTSGETGTKVSVTIPAFAAQR
jgi:signal transduction histidine kinase